MKKVIFLVLAFVSTFTIFGQSDKDKVQETVTKSKIEGHIYFLADDLLKGRETGTPENKIAASYLANTLRSYGVQPNPQTKTYYQEVNLQKTTPPSDVNLSINGTIIKDYALLDVAAIDFSKGAVYVGYGLEQDYKGKSVDGKVVIVKGGSADTKDTRAAFGLLDQKSELAKTQGAVAVIELLNAEEQMWGFIEHNFNASSLGVAKKEKKGTMPYVWVLDKENKMANGLTKNKSISIAISMSGPKEEVVTSQNVIGIVEGTDPVLKEEYIIYSGHYDHVGIGTPDATGDTIYNGARDNAVGTTTVLSMAENLAKYPTKRSALFILFTGEEKGLLGSSFYVENPVLPLKQMVYCFNSDNAGYNDTSLATIIGLPRTTASQHIKDAASAFGLTAVDDPAPEQGLFDRSDNVRFAAKGIPAPTFSLGFTAFNGDVTKYYHRPGDEAQTLDYDYLYKFFSAYVLAGRNIGNDPVTPTWTVGDKYEVAGKALYKN
ncbi:M28 family peptidase [uncultured Dokdonia sp.]|uniref:M28 family peptidase n=1 Tax=uncultured Dokdonia sp. TaxID=575653 RepID=UPI0026341A7E|nr:M28 family peptidase [uncultured Dokdonia sp.]